LGETFPITDGKLNEHLNQKSYDAPVPKGFATPPLPDCLAYCNFFFEIYPGVGMGGGGLLGPLIQQANQTQQYQPNWLANPPWLGNSKELKKKKKALGAFLTPQKKNYLYI
jgi:hypothetical protein